MSHNKLINTIAVLASLLFFPLVCTAGGEFELSRFIEPETCGDCHSDIYGQWENSMHNLSEKDPVYLLLSEYLRKGLTDPDEIKEAESCVKCHVPVGVVTGYPEKVSDDKKKIPELALKGIQCDYCHSAVDAKKMYNNGLVLEPGHGEDEPGVKRGPRPDAESDFHDTAFSELHTSSKICGTCHNVNHVVFGTKLETTYDEWEKGPYNSDDPKKRVTCQGCHMYQRPGIPATGSTPRPDNKGLAADDGPERRHVFTHYFVGGNSYIPPYMGNDEEKRKMAEERLTHSATLSIGREELKNGRLTIRVKNTGAGHYLPTGLTDVRQMWLEIIVRDAGGKTIYSSGRLDRDNYLPDDAIIFNTVFGDGRGNPTHNISKAREILSDKRIPPLQSLSETIQLPKGDWKQVTVAVRLLYRSAPQKILDMASKKGQFTLPVVTMAEAREEIRIN